MSRTYRSTNPPAPVATNGRVVRENNRRPWSRAWKKFTHHRERRSVQSEIRNQQSQIQPEAI